MASIAPRHPLRILVLGAGGREHALVHHLLQDDQVQHVYCAPGNGGTGGSERCTNLSMVVGRDFTQIAQWSVENKINLCIPGPEQPLVDGVEAAFRAVGIPVFGPSPFAAQMEGDKAFSKDFMARHSIPTAAFQSFGAEQVDDALAFIAWLGGAHNVVLKASGLAAGKGVLLPETQEEARAGVEDILVKRVFGDAGNTLLIEARLTGPELSVLVFSDGYTYRALPGCQDHKRIGEGDTGPNTGGMGAYAPAPEGLQGDLTQRIEREILEPSFRGMRKDGFPFVGLLFIGLMLTPSGPQVLEYNVRFGDPETEALLSLLDTQHGGGASLADIMLACTAHRLDCVDLRIKRDRNAVSVVLASEGYPGKYEVGKEITIGQLPPNTTVFHAGTKLENGKLLTAGGRVLVVSSHGPTLADALRSVYAAVDQVSFAGKTFRRDIAHRALALASAGAAPGGLTYASAGVSIDNGNALVDAIKPLAKSTRRPGCDAALGGFGGTFDLKAIGMRDPVLVSGTDGVGTKLRIALDAAVHDTVGIDLVAMSVNDLLVQGALPLYFLDYFACSRLVLPTATAVIAGIAEGCRQSNCALIGGETAEMPGMYAGEEYDLAGFAVGAVERDALLPRLDDMQPGDVLLGLRSSGVHSNGFSLVRKILARAGVSLDEPCPWDASQSTAAALLTPTRIYVRALTPLLSSPTGVRALCHITGGGFTDNLPRVLPAGAGLEAHLDLRGWVRPPVFSWLQRAGAVRSPEMARTFNNGVGMVLVVDAARVGDVQALLAQGGETDVLRLGEIRKQSGGEQVTYQGWQAWDAPQL